MITKPDAVRAAPLTRTDIARIYRHVYGVPRMDELAEQFAREVERATVEALAEQPASSAVERLRNLAEHLRHCRECGETDVSNCPEGEALWDASMPQPAAEIGATPPAAPNPEDTNGAA